jgi:nitroimidazol reductase NimA-like FMN-containing flavoprotein (pyridoxamine 5'-phosphate oxidase superfamily)
MTDQQISPRVKVRRDPGKGRYDRTSVAAALDRGQVAHVAFVEDGFPYCIPMLYARSGDVVYIHGSTGSRAMRTLAAGVPACLTATRLDGLVLARSVFEHTANYESVVVLGRFRPVGGKEARLAAFEALTERLLPGRWGEARRPSRRELAATVILAMPIDEASVKLRTGGPDDDDSADAGLDVWAGEIPVTTSYGQPTASPGLRPGVPLPPSVARLLAIAPRSEPTPARIPGSAPGPRRVRP